MSPKVTCATAATVPDRHLAHRRTAENHVAASSEHGNSDNGQGATIMNAMAATMTATADARLGLGAH